MGCYNCDFTRKAYPLIKQLLSENEANFTFIHFPTKDETTYLLKYDYCITKHNPEVYFSFVDKMFASDKAQVTNEAFVHRLLGELDVDPTQIAECVEQEETQEVVDDLVSQITLTNIYGTPTVYVNGTAVVGPKPYRVYRRLLNNSLF